MQSGVSSFIFPAFNMFSTGIGAAIVVSTLTQTAYDVCYRLSLPSYEEIKTSLVGGAAIGFLSQFLMANVRSYRFPRAQLFYPDIRMAAILGIFGPNMGTFIDSKVAAQSRPTLPHPFPKYK
jgi:hypothetical protein